MLRRLRLLPFVLGVYVLYAVTVVSLALAQAAAAPDDPKTLRALGEVLLKIAAPPLWTAMAPWLTGMITTGVRKYLSEMPPQVQVMLSACLGAVLAGFTGAIPDFPMTIESSAQMGFSSGMTGQYLVQAHPSTFKCADPSPIT